MLYKQKVTIKKIEKHSMPFCNSRHMTFNVITENGENVIVPWATMPSFMIDNISPPKPSYYFDWFWEHAAEGQNAYLCHGKDQNCNYLEPLSLT